MDTLLPDNICKTCGHSFQGYFCNVCGEKVILPQDKSFRAFLSSIFQALTLADGKITRTLWLILKRPGFVSHESAAGRKVRYLSPLSLFFALNLIYFLFPLIQLFNASLKTQLRSPLKAVVQEVVARKMIHDSIHSIASFSLLYDQKTAALAKLIVMVFVVIAALPLSLLYRRKGVYFMDHMGLTTELVCFNLFINALLLTFILRFSGLGQYTNDQVLTIIFLVTNFYFLVRAGNEFYGQKGLLLVGKTVLMILCLKVALEVYRAVLFFVTIWTI